MQFYASVARKPGSRRAETSIKTSQKPALDIKYSAFSTPEEEEEEECRGEKRVSYGSSFTSPTVPVLHGELSRADVDAELS